MARYIFLVFLKARSLTHLLNGPPPGSLHAGLIQDEIDDVARIGHVVLLGKDVGSDLNQVGLKLVLDINIHEMIG